MRSSFAKDILKDIREFVGFFRSLWGLLAGGSLFFPLVNLVVDAIPYPYETVQKQSAAVAMVGSTFVFLLVYLTRQLIGQMDDANLRLPLPGYRSKVLSIVFLVLLGILVADYMDAVWSDSYGITSYSRSLIGGVFEYGLIFTLATLTFSVLATSEYMRQLAMMQDDQRGGWPRSEVALNAIYTRVPEEERPTCPSELEVLEETRRRQYGVPVLEMIVISERGWRHKVQVDRFGNVLEYKRY